MRSAALGALVAAAYLGGCGGVAADAGERARAAGTPTAKPLASVAYVRPSRLLPEPDPELLEAALAVGEPQRQLVSGLRLVVQVDGTVARADERFGPGAVYAVDLPERMGGGFLFYQSDSDGTKIWRAADWVGPLEPLAAVGMSIREIVVGFDRLYLRSEASNRLLALDPTLGTAVGTGGLPVASGYGAMAYADGWRGLVDTELRGPLASFDAGWSWHRVVVPEPVLGVGIEEGSPVLHVADGRYRIDPTGHVQRLDDPPPVEEHESLGGDRPAGPDGAAAGRSAQPLGPHPLRAALLAGWPESDQTAIVARAGALMRVGLPDGRVLATTAGAYPDRDAQCVGAAVGRGFGFVCGQARGATTVYEAVDPLQLRPFVRFDGPRFVSPSGNGALVVRGPCVGTAKPSEVRTYCVVRPNGTTREIGVRGDVGSERLVALADGRVVVLVPPRLGAGGRLTVIGDDALAAVSLRFKGQSAEAVRLAERGLWLEGFQQRGTGSVGGWIEAGGPALGVEVGLDGSVRLGRIVDMGGAVLVAGRFGLAVSEPEGAIETTDGGRHWSTLELPSLPDAHGDPATRGCSPVGCALRGWVRVGWGPPAAKGDLGLVAAPPPARGVEADIRPVRLRCTVGAPTDAPSPAAPSHGEAPASDATSGNWVPFLGAPPPRLSKDQEGVAKGTSSYDPVPAHAYVWGPKGADWTRAGLWQLRFGDRFDPAGGVRISAPTRSPWPDRDAAAREIGVQGRGGYWRWLARTDPGGRCALVSACLGTACRLYATCDGQAILPVRDATGSLDGLPVPLVRAAVRLGESWYFLAEVGRDSIELWRVELGVAQPIARFPRLDRRGYTGAPPPTLVRRAIGREIGLLVTAPPEPGQPSRVSTWVVLPVDLRAGQLEEPVVLGPADLGGKLPPPCAADEDGWLAEVELETATVVNLVAGQSYLDGIEYRLRLDSDGSCTQAMAARATRPPFTGAPAPARGRGSSSLRSAATAGGDVLLVARDPGATTRWPMGCVSSD